MIAQHHELTRVEDNLTRQILIKENQLRIAQESHMVYVVQTLQSQLSSLHSKLSELEDHQFNVWMSLLDDD